MTGYYDRAGGMNSDGTPTFADTSDLTAERRVDDLVEKTWGCIVHKLPPLSPIDRYIEKDGRLVGYLEIKTRHHPAARWPNVWLNHRKYMALLNAHLAMGVTSLFVVQFDDQIRWVNIAYVVPKDLRMAGTTRRVKSDTDQEPMVWIPVAQMNLLYPTATQKGTEE